MTYRRFSRLGKVAVALVAFAAFLLVADSGGIYSWAERLDLGPERTVALPLATGLNKAMRPLGLEQLRRRELAELARVGWSDDPAALAAESGASPTPPSSPKGAEATPGTEPPAPPATPGGVPSATGAGASGCDSPVMPAGMTTSLISSGLPDLHLQGMQPPLQVALAGDSMMAVGLSSTIYNHAGAYPNLSFVKAFKSGTGLARPEVFNWQTEYPAMLAQAQPKVILVAIGANDGQGFVDDGTTYPFGTPGWKQIYAQRLQAYLHMLEAGGAKVVWLELPPMRSASYNNHIEAINCIAYTAVSADPAAVWISTDKIVGDDSGAFRDFGVLNGKEVRLRQNDGIHLSNEGASLVADPVLAWLNAQANGSSASGTAPAGATTTPPPAAASTPR